MVGILDVYDDFEDRNKGVSADTLRLHEAAANGSPEEIKAIIESGTHVDARDGLELTPLMSASYNERFENIAVLLKEGADIRVSDTYKCTVLHLACKNKGADCAMALVEAGADMEAKDVCDNKPLHVASALGTKELLEYYISKSESIEDSNNERRTPLLMAAGLGELPNLKTLIDHGADISVKDQMECSLLHIAARNANPEVLRHVLNLGVSIDARDISDCTPLFSAAYFDNAENVRILLDAGADINAINKKGETSLHTASTSAGEETVKILSASKSIVNQCDSQGNSPLHEAAIQNNLAAAKTLLESGADINCRDSHGRTPILTAAETNQVEMLKFLFEAGADTSVAAKDGSDLCAMALEAKKTSNALIGGDECWKFLKEKGFQFEEESEPGIGSSTETDDSGGEEHKQNKMDGNKYAITRVDGRAFMDWALPLAERGASVKYADLLDRTGISFESGRSLDNWFSITDTLAEMGVGVAPHTMLTRRIPGFDQPVLLYKSNDNHQHQNKKNGNFTFEIINLGIGAFVLSFGKYSAKEVGLALRKVLPTMNRLNENELAGLQANIEYFKANPPTQDFIDNLYETGSEDLSHFVRRVAINFVRALNAGKAKKLALMETYYKHIKVDPSLAKSDLQSGVPKKANSSQDDQ